MAFKKGQSGNPKGRPRGIINQAKLRTSIAKDIPEILVALTNAAKSGDVAACKLLLDRVLPALKPEDAPVRLPLGQDLAQDGKAILSALGAAQITPDQAAKLLQGLGAFARVLEIDELERRIAALEET
jgi:Family of unknown function (DUF5681)